MRIGIGFDVHKLVKNRDLIIGGVKIPHTLGLLGHSDADVLTHAIMDSILGACGKSDIGVFFPDNDQNYKNADSIKLLEKVVQMIINDGYKICNIDCVIIAQKPKLSPFVSQMKERIAAACKIEISQIGIKATTTETLGFNGREEGISAQVVCLCEK